MAEDIVIADPDRAQEITLLRHPKDESKIIGINISFTEPRNLADYLNWGAMHSGPPRGPQVFRGRPEETPGRSVVKKPCGG